MTDTHYYWKFDPWGEDDREEDPKYEEFFKSTNRIEAMVREFIQNSLDAKQDDESHVEVRFYMGKLDSEDFGKYSEGLRMHLKGAEFHSKRLEAHEIPYLLIEDFKTKGLTGSLRRPSRYSDESSRFHNFWSRSGISDKQKKHGGRWGLGKTTFHMLSELRGYWGLTKRATDEQELLQGFCEVNSHYLPEEFFEDDDFPFDEQDFFKPYGYYKDFEGEESAPISNKDVIQDFREDFKLDRTNESGLSLVIPIPLAKTSTRSILKSAIIHYFVPILNGDLAVKVEDYNGYEKVLDAEKIKEEATNLSWNGTSWEDYSDQDIEDILHFTEKAIKSTETEEFIDFDLQSGDIRDEESWDKEDYKECKKRYQEGKPIPVRFKMEVTPLEDGEKQDSEETYFDVFVKTLGRERDRPLDFVFRGGIHLNEESLDLGNRSVMALLHAEDKIISQFLGDAEVPAHTRWNLEASNFKDKYYKPKKTLGKVRNATSKLVNVLEDTEQKLDRQLLKDYFSVPIEEEPEIEDDGEEDEEENNGEDDDEPPVTPPPGGKPPCLVKKSGDDGVRITPNKDDTAGKKMEVTVAYHNSGTNALDAHSELDFSLEKDIAIRGDQFQKLESGTNTVTVIFENKDGSVELTGFDRHRDVLVDVSEAE